MTSAPLIDTPSGPSRPAAVPSGLSPRSNFSWALVGNLVFTVCQWAMVVVLAKLGTPAMVGLFSLALAITAPVIIFANLNLRTVQATDARSDYQFGDYLAMRLAALAAALVVIAGIVVVSPHDPQTMWVVGMVTVAKIFDSLSDVIYGRLQQFERMDRIATSRIIQGVLQLVVLAVAVFATRSLVWGTACMALASGCVTLGYDAPTLAWVTRARAAVPARGSDSRAELKPRWSRATLLSLARITLPLGLAAALGSLNANVPRYFIEQSLGKHALGIFSAIAYLMWAGGVVTGSLFQSASPRLSRHYVQDPGAYLRLLRKLVLIAVGNGMLGVLLATVCGRWLLTLLYSSEYAGQPALFGWLMVAAGVSYAASALGAGIAAARCFGPQLPVYVAMVTATAIGCAWLVPHYGLQGAAWAFLAGTLVWLGGFVLIIQRLVRLQVQTLRGVSYPDGDEELAGVGENRLEQEERFVCSKR